MLSLASLRRGREHLDRKADWISKPQRLAVHAGTNRLSLHQPTRNTPSVFGGKETT